MYFNTEPTKLVGFPKTAGVQTNKIRIVLVARFYISD